MTLCVHAAQSKEAGIRTLVALDDQGGEFITTTTVTRDIIQHLTTNYTTSWKFLIRSLKALCFWETEQFL